MFLSMTLFLAAQVQTPPETKPLADIQTLEVIPGAGSPIKLGDWVRIHYKIESDGRVLTNSRANGLAYADTVSPEQMPSFMCKGLIGLKTGGSRKFIVPKEMAKQNPNPKPLPPYAELQVTVWVIQHKPSVQIKPPVQDNPPKQ